MNITPDTITEKQTYTWTEKCINQNNLGHFLDRYPLGLDTHVHRSKSFLKIKKKNYKIFISFKLISNNAF